jgi:hypothetical protein
MTGSWWSSSDTDGVEMSFEIHGTPARLTRNDSFGGSYLEVAGAVHRLESPWSPKTHFSFTTKRLNSQVGDHLIEIVQVKERWWLGPQRPDFTVIVDGEVVATQKGSQPSH